MRLDFQFNIRPNQDANFACWSPTPCRIRVTDPSDAPVGNSFPVSISATSAPTAGQVQFSAQTNGPWVSTLTLDVPIGGVSVPFFVSGKFGRASSQIGDVTVEARLGADIVGSDKLMVRIRKDATKLSADERDRFVAAFARLN